MAKKNNPIITHTKILCLAIRCLENEIDDMKRRCEGRPGVEELLQSYVEPRSVELAALKDLYRIETGAEYC